MTGTPFVNKPYDIENIMAMISKRGNSQLLEKDFDKLIEDEAVLKYYFNYRISYFNIMAKDGKTFFPTVSYEYVPVQLTSKKYINLMKKKVNLQQILKVNMIYQHQSHQLVII